MVVKGKEGGVGVVQGKPAQGGEGVQSSAKGVRQVLLASSSWAKKDPACTSAQNRVSAAGTAAKAQGQPQTRP